ncbi:ferric siderophore receptor [Acinetobacter larvae]|uniref:Ferric siderophore receptor n=1 Tax=Acinetobacter larvae TaxID=1789224 RepID=A0A1B2M4C9_9GAMM|nr:ferric siderophore receptor [Acinetobacter larvae]
MVYAASENTQQDPYGLSKKVQVANKIAVDLAETPQSINVVSQQQMALQQAHSSSEALRYSAGLNSEKFGGFGSYLDLTRIRGVDADYYLDGIRVVSNPGSWLPQIDAFGLEKIEVLRGPASATYGQGLGGGVVNQISKRPQEESRHAIQIGYGRYDEKRLGLDSTGPLNQSGSLLYRTVVSALDSDNQIQNSHHRRLYFAPSITWRPNAQLDWTVMGSYTREPELPNYNALPAVFYGLNQSTYPALDRHQSYTDYRANSSSRTQKSLSSLLQYRLNEQWRLVSNARYMHIDSDIYRSIVYGYQEQNGRPMLKGYYEDTPATVSTFSIDQYITGQFNTGALGHDLAVGVDYTTGTLKNALYSVGPILFDPYQPPYHTEVTPDFSSSYAAPWKEQQDFDRIGFYVQDQLSYQGWRLNVAARYDHAKNDQKTNIYSPNVTELNQNEKKWSYRGALSYVFEQGWVPYISYSTAFDPILGTKHDGSLFVPVETKQTELGLKYKMPNQQLLLTAAIFQLNQTNLKTGDAEHLGFNLQAGEVRSRGLDLQAIGKLTPQININAGYTYLDNELIKDTTYQGKGLTQTPEHSATLWLDYHFDRTMLAGLTLGTGVRYLGSSYGDPKNHFKVPAATLWDISLHYALDAMLPSLKQSSIALKVDNVSNKHYVASCTSQMYCFVGQDRNVRLSFDYQW